MIPNLVGELLPGVLYVSARAISAHLPFLHFFVGFRTSHEYRNIRLIETADLERILDHKAVAKFRGRSLNLGHPLEGHRAKSGYLFSGQGGTKSLF